MLLRVQWYKGKMKQTDASPRSGLSVRFKVVQNYHCWWQINQWWLWIHYSKSHIKHLKYLANESQFAPRVLWNDVYSRCNSRSKSQLLHLWMNELYHPLVFFASLEFKCMQRSKLPFRRQRWCNKQKPPDYSHSSPSSTVTESKPPSHIERCYCKLSPGGRSAQECFLLPPPLPYDFLSVAVCRSAHSKCR